MTKKRTISELERLRDTVRNDYKLGFIRKGIAIKLLKGYNRKIDEARRGKAR